MKKLLVSMFRVLTHLWSCVYTYGVSQFMSRVWETLYSLWVSQFIGKVGKNTCFERPLLLQGGGQSRIKVGSYTCFGHHCVLGCWVKFGSGESLEHYNPEIVIGDHCSIGEYCHITAINRITIGDGLLTGRFVYIGDNAHGGLSMDEADTRPVRRHLTSKGEIKIGRNVWIGDKVSIFGGVTIGDNVIIGAGSIVTHDIPSNSMAAGMPARVIKQL